MSLAAADGQVDREASAPDRTGPRALPDHTPDSSRASSTDTSDGAVPRTDPRARPSEGQPDHPRYVALRRRRSRWRRRWRRRWWRWWVRRRWRRRWRRRLRWWRWRWRRRGRWRRRSSSHREHAVHEVRMDVALEGVVPRHEGHDPGLVPGPGDTSRTVDARA